MCRSKFAFNKLLNTQPQVQHSANTGKTCYPKYHQLVLHTISIFIFLDSLYIKNVLLQYYNGISFSFTNVLQPSDTTVCYSSLGKQRNHSFSICTSRYLQCKNVLVLIQLNIMKQQMNVHPEIESVTTVIHLFVCIKHKKMRE